MSKYDPLASCRLQRRVEEKEVTRQNFVRPYSQCAREGNEAFPVFSKLCNSPLVSKKKKHKTSDPK